LDSKTVKTILVGDSKKKSDDLYKCFDRQTDRQTDRNVISISRCQHTDAWRNGSTQNAIIQL